MTVSEAEKIRKDKLQSLLSARKTRLLAALRKSMEEQRTENSSMSFELAQDDGDKSVEDHERHIQASVQSIKSEELDVIDLALERLAAGTYGICAECGCEIPLQRLAVQTFASYCVACQEKIDAVSRRDKNVSKEMQSYPADDYDYLPGE